MRPAVSFALFSILFFIKHNSCFSSIYVSIIHSHEEKVTLTLLGYILILVLLFQLKLYANI